MGSTGNAACRPEFLIFVALPTPWLPPPVSMAENDSLAVVPHGDGLVRRRVEVLDPPLPCVDGSPRRPRCRFPTGEWLPLEANLVRRWPGMVTHRVALECTLPSGVLWVATPTNFAAPRHEVVGVDRGASGSPARLPRWIFVGRRSPLLGRVRTGSGT